MKVGIVLRLINQRFLGFLLKPFIPDGSIIHRNHGKLVPYHGKNGTSCKIANGGKSWEIGMVANPPLLSPLSPLSLSLERLELFARYAMHFLVIVCREGWDPMHHRFLGKCNSGLCTVQEWLLSMLTAMVSQKACPSQWPHPHRPGPAMGAH